MKTITQLKQGCGKEIDNEYIGNTPVEDYICSEHNLCNPCESTLKQTIAIQEIIIQNYKKCKEGLEKIKSQKPRENNTPRDWDQRLDELILLYTQINGTSYNESKKEILNKINGGEK